MTPSKPKATEQRKTWLASLMPGDDVYLWRATQGWALAKVSRLGSRIELKVARHDNLGVTRFDGLCDIRGLSRLTGSSVECGECNSAVYHLGDPAAQKGYEADRARRSLRGVAWAKVSDYAIARILEVLRQDKEGA